MKLNECQIFRCCNAKALSARSSSQSEHGDLPLSSQSYVELRDLQIAARIGTYDADDVVPDAHLLDLTLTIAPDLVLIARDEMAMVFDYDPLIRQIDALARTSHFETQERLMTLIVEACTDYPQIEALDVCLRKQPVLSGTGTLGVRLIVDAEDMAALRLAVV
jgi:dihydroneopterin aldolase